MGVHLDVESYRVLANFRHALRRFLAFSETKAAEAGLTAQQHQALLAIKAAAPGQATVGYLAEMLIVKPQSASGLVDRLEAMNCVDRRPAAGDKRKAELVLTIRAQSLLVDLSAMHLEEIRRLRPMLARLLDEIP